MPLRLSSRLVQSSIQLSNDPSRWHIRKWDDWWRDQCSSSTRCSSWNLARTPPSSLSSSRSLVRKSICSSSIPTCSISSSSVECRWKASVSVGWPSASSISRSTPFSAIFSERMSPWKSRRICNNRPIISSSSIERRFFTSPYFTNLTPTISSNKILSPCPRMFSCPSVIRCVLSNRKEQKETDRLFLSFFLAVTRPSSARTTAFSILAMSRISSGSTPPRNFCIATERWRRRWKRNFISIKMSLNGISQWRRWEALQMVWPSSRSITGWPVALSSVMNVTNLSSFASEPFAGWYRHCGLIPFTQDSDFGLYAEEYDESIRNHFLGHPSTYLWGALGLVSALSVEMHFSAVI